MRSKEFTLKCLIIFYCFLAKIADIVEAITDTIINLCKAEILLIIFCMNIKYGFMDIVEN
ncbi:hypothetical protein NCCP28_28440 [Niallia sp. NCCP-28]|nr:hypothetical protein NCCP28_28440 [Niallia sp. NCCP-28]